MKFRLNDLGVLAFLWICMSFACERSTIEPEVSAAKVPFQTLLQDPFTFCNDTLVTVAIRSEQEELLFLQQFPPSKPLPRVDYDREMVIGFLSGRSGISVSATIDSIIRLRSTLTVHSTIFYPEYQLWMVGWPTHLVTVRKTYESVHFAPPEIIFEWQQ